MSDAMAVRYGTPIFATIGKYIDGFTMGRATNGVPCLERQTFDWSIRIERKPEVANLQLDESGSSAPCIELATILVVWSIFGVFAYL